MHFGESVESVADPDLEDGELQKMLISPLYRKLRGNPIHCFHLGRETWSGVLCSETLIRRTWKDLFLKATRITCSIRGDQTWRSKSFMSSPSMSASVNYNDKQKSKDWRCRKHNTDMLNLDENKYVYKKNYLWRKKFSKTLRSEICTNWENEESSRTTKRWILSAEIKIKSRDNAAAHFPIAANDGSLSSQGFGAGTSVSKIQRQSCTPRWHCKRCFRFVCSVHWARIISITDDSRISHGHNITASRMFRTSSRCSIRLYSGQKWKMHQRYQKFQSQNVQIFGVWKTQSFLSKGICAVIHWQAY